MSYDEDEQEVRNFGPVGEPGGEQHEVPAPVGVVAQLEGAETHLLQTVAIGMGVAVVVVDLVFGRTSPTDDSSCKAKPTNQRETTWYGILRSF